MSKANEVHTWLIGFFAERFLGWLGDTFYYDKRDKEFYPVHPTDVFLLNEDNSYNKDLVVLMRMTWRGFLLKG